MGTRRCTDPLRGDGSGHDRQLEHSTFRFFRRHRTSVWNGTICLSGDVHCDRTARRTEVGAIARQNISFFFSLFSVVVCELSLSVADLVECTLRNSSFIEHRKTWRSSSSMRKTMSSIHRCCTKLPLADFSPAW